MSKPNEPTPSAPDLSAAPLHDLIMELFRRERAGDCLALVITPSDLSEYWESDESGATNPGSREPDAGEMHACKKAFERWQDCGGFTEIMEICRDAWDAAKEKDGRA